MGAFSLIVVINLLNRKRCDAQLLARKIAEDNLSDIEATEDGVDEQYEEASTVNAFTTSGLCSYSSRPRKQHKTPRLMLSEWLVDVPEDFETSCYVMPCPVGKRNLVTASQVRISSKKRCLINQNIRAKLFLL